MKKIKIAVLAVVLLVGAATVLAFKAIKAPASSYQVIEQFQYAGPDPYVSTSYTLITGTPPTCLGATQVCIIKAQQDGSTGRPILTDALKEEIRANLASGTHESANVILKGS
jgi:hypothetical protein